MLIKEIKVGNSTIYNVDTTEDRKLLEARGLDVAQLEVDEQAKIDAVAQRLNAKMNSDYNGTNVSLTSEDAVGLLQVQSAFALGVNSTDFRFANGIVMELTAANFEAFATFFATERNKLFV